MATTNYRGVSIPSVGDGLLAGLEASFATAGVITRVASVAAARLAIAEAVAGGATVSTSRPMYLDIGGVFYKADGTMSDGVYVLKPFNETEARETARGSGGTFSPTPGQFIAVVTSSLPARPYARAVTCFGSLYGIVSGTGQLMVLIRIQGTDTAGGTRFDVESAYTSATTTNFGVIPAGEAPLIQLGVYARDYAGTAPKVVLSAVDAYNRLFVEAKPITMAE